MQIPSRSLVALALLAGAVAPLSAADDASERIDALFAPSAGGKLPGAAVLVLRDGVVVHSKAYGLANVEQELPRRSAA